MLQNITMVPFYSLQSVLEHQIAARVTFLEKLKCLLRGLDNYINQ